MSDLTHDDAERALTDLAEVDGDSDAVNLLRAYIEGIESENAAVFDEGQRLARLVGALKQDIERLLAVCECFVKELSAKEGTR